MTDNVLALGEGGEYEAQNCLPPLNLIRRTALQTYTKLSFDELKAQAQFETEKAAIKSKYPNAKDVFRLKVGDAVAWVRKPDRKDISMSRTLGEGDEISIKETLLDAIWLEGDERIKTDDDYFFNAFAVLDNLIEAKASELKKS